MTEPNAPDRRYRRPESVLVIVHTTALECLVLERVDPPGFWQSVTGTLGWDETPAEAAARELVEETGIDAAGLLRDAGMTRQFPILPAWRSRYAPAVTANTEHEWTLELPERPAVTLNAAEHVAFDWLKIDEAIARVASWTNREALERLLRVEQNHK